MQHDPGLPFDQAAGKLVEFAAFQYFQKVCDLFGEDRSFREISGGLWRFAKAGITTATDIGYHEGALSCYERMYRLEKFPVRIRLYPRSLFEAPPLPNTDWGGEDVKMIGIKV